MTKPNPAPSGPVHFIWLGGQWRWQYDRAIDTARVHGAEIVVHRAGGPPAGEMLSPRVTVAPLDLPDWLRDHPMKLANVKDLYAWAILRDHGGLYLDLDTISLRPVWDLLTREVLVSYEHDDEYHDDHAYNSAAVAAVAGSPMCDAMAEAAKGILINGVSQWGSCGPRLLTTFVRDYPEYFDVAPFGVLNGWRDGTIRRYYDGERPGPDVRVVHLFSSSNMDAFTADRWMPSEPPS